MATFGPIDTDEPYIIPSGLMFVPTAYAEKVGMGTPGCGRCALVAGSRQCNAHRCTNGIYMTRVDFAAARLIGSSQER